MAGLTGLRDESHNAGEMQPEPSGDERCDRPSSGQDRERKQYPRRAHSSIQ